jgi:hypothetical protein
MNVRNNSLSSNILFYTTLLGEETIYSVQATELPGINISHPEIATRVGMMYQQGSVVSYNPINIRLIIDHSLKGWKDIMSLIQKYHIPNSNTNECLTGTSWLEISDNNNNYLFKIVLHNSLIRTVNNVQYSSAEDDDVVILDAEIVYDYFTIE